MLASRQLLDERTRQRPTSPGSCAAAGSASSPTTEAGARRRPACASSSPRRLARAPFPARLRTRLLACRSVRVCGSPTCSQAGAAARCPLSPPVRQGELPRDLGRPVGLPWCTQGTRIFGQSSMGGIEAATQKITVKLPDGTPLELPGRRHRRRRRGGDRPGPGKGGAGDPRRRRAARPLRAAARRGRDRDPHRPRSRGAGADPPRRRPRDGRGGAGALPRDQGDDRPADRATASTTTSTSPTTSRSPTPTWSGSRRRCAPTSRPTRSSSAATSRSPRRSRSFKAQGEDYKVELIEDLVARRRRRDRLALPQRPLRGPLPRPARPLDRPDQGDQAQLARRRLLARRREPRRC